MSVPSYSAKSILDHILRGRSQEKTAEELRPRPPQITALPPHLKRGCDHTEEGLYERRRLLKFQGINTEQLAGEGKEISPAELEGNIEHFIGFARIPVGVIGPLRINGTNAHGDFFVPMATTEGSLVASYDRGAHVISLAGGATVLCLEEFVSRAPCFVFDRMAEAALFLSWILSQFESFQDTVAQTTRHGRLVDVKVSLNGKEVFLIFKFTTGDAAGQNMVTIATEAICKKLIEDTPYKPRRWYLEGNMSGDKKATMLSFTSTRGKCVVAEVIISKDLIHRYLHTWPEELVRYWGISIVGGIQSGSIGVQGHYANGLTALFIACGQDVACVSEASVGVTRIDLTEEGDLYVSVKLPNLIVGTVGGGTYLPTARECLEMLGCHGPSQARKFAEICAATILAGEISIVSSLAAGYFGQAHAKYGRKAK